MILVVVDPVGSAETFLGQPVDSIVPDPGDPVELCNACVLTIERGCPNGMIVEGAGDHLRMRVAVIRPASRLEHYLYLAADPFVHGTEARARSTMSEGQQRCYATEYSGKCAGYVW